MPEQSLSDHFRAFAATVERDGGTTYPVICRSVADHVEVLSLLDLAPVPQRRPLLLLAAVHYLLLSGAAHRLAAYYDTVAAVRGTEPSAPGPAGLPEAFVDFCAVHREELAELVATRSTQTNEVGRCTALLPGLCHIASQHRGARLSLLDLGTSAGLNLLFDDYAYTFRPATGGEPLTAGPADAALTLDCEVRGDPTSLPDLRLPAMAQRVGLDLAPVDASSEDDALWLLACQWPDNPGRFGRLRAALANAKAAVPPLRLERGDMVSDLARVAATISRENPLVVFHSWVAAYLDEVHQHALAAEVRDLASHRPVHYLYCEAPYETPGLPTPPRPVPVEGPDLATALVYVGPNGAEPVRLADTHPHGYWIRWWPPAAA